MKSKTTIDGYKSYYGSLEFQNDLLSWFKVEKNRTLNIPWIGIDFRHGNPNRISSMPSQTREKSFYFSFCIFLHTLQAQAINKVSGEEMMNKFHAETGVPMVSCGLGGIMHPSHILKEAELLPEGPEIPAYIEMIDTIMPAIRPQIEELDKYAQTDKLYTIIEEETMAFRDRLEKGLEHPSYFINM